MSLSKEKIIDQTTVTDTGLLMIREKTVIMDNGVEISSSFHRSILEPGDDLTNQPANVVTIAQAVWTPEIISAYKISKQEALSIQGIQ